MAGILVFKDSFKLNSKKKMIQEHARHSASKELMSPTFSQLLIPGPSNLAILISCTRFFHLTFILL